MVLSVLFFKCTEPSTITSQGFSLAIAALILLKLLIMHVLWSNPCGRQGLT
jgi:hypothetical protein